MDQFLSKAHKLHFTSCLHNLKAIKVHRVSHTQRRERSCARGVGNGCASGGGRKERKEEQKTHPPIQTHKTSLPLHTTTAGSLQTPCAIGTQPEHTWPRAALRELPLHRQRTHTEGDDSESHKINRHTGTFAKFGREFCS